MDKEIMCGSDECPEAEKCYRHEKKPFIYQDYGYFYHQLPECPHFIPIIVDKKDKYKGVIE